MKKFFIIPLIAVGFVCFEAKALVQQSASEALSFNNVVNVSSASKVGTVRQTKKENSQEKKVLEPQEVDIRSSVSKNVTLAPTQMLVVLLPEKEGQSWKITHDESKIYMLSSESIGNYRQIRFEQKSSQGSSLYFDCINHDGEVIQNKAVYVRGN